MARVIIEIDRATYSLLLTEKQRTGIPIKFQVKTLIENAMKGTPKQPAQRTSALPDDDDYDDGFGRPPVADDEPF